MLRGVSGSAIPGPRGLPALGSLLELERDSLGFLTETARRYGPVSRFRLLHRFVVQLADPEDIEQVLVRCAADYRKDRFTQDLARALGQGLVTSEGEHWKRHRKLAAFAFTPQRIAAQAGTMVDAALQRIGSWRAGGSLNVHQEMSRLTLDVVCRTLFHTQLAPGDEATVERGMEVLNHFFAEALESVLLVPPWLPTPNNLRLSRAIARIDAILLRMIARRRAEPAEGGDLLGALVHARDEQGVGLSDRELRDECMTLLLAGHETTALALTHAFYALGTHSDLRRRFQQELVQVLGDEPPDATSARDLSLTERIIKESMRLHPPVWAIGRQPLRDVRLGGHDIPAGTELVMSQWVVHRDPRFFPDPEAFDPDRFLPERARALPRFAYFPFGGGPRVCVGSHFAMLEAVLLLATIGQRFHLELEPGARLEFRPSVTLRPKGRGLLATARSNLTPRHHSNDL
ncbi:MAG: cytochrome P450 [Polyangiaceae bacterium]|nr:cytochrome P450 [Polyangiaceae bacterium]